MNRSVDKIPISILFEVSRFQSSAGIENIRDRINLELLTQKAMHYIIYERQKLFATDSDLKKSNWPRFFPFLVQLLLYLSQHSVRMWNTLSENPLHSCSAT